MKGPGKFYSQCLKLSSMREGLQVKYFLIGSLRRPRVKLDTIPGLRRVRQGPAAYRFGCAMIISANQPYFCPFPGFFYKAFLSDILVILDEVQFPQGTTWINRNRFKNDQGTLWLTIPVWKKGLGLQQINQVRICQEGRWPRKHLQSLTSAYAHAPYLGDHLAFLEEVLSRPWDKLVDLNLTIIHYLMGLLQVKTKLVLLSELGIAARGTQLLVEISRAFRASTFLAQSQAQKYLDAALFQESGVKLSFFKYEAPIYPQLWGDFVANLSTFDLVLNCGPRAWPIVLEGEG